MTTQNTQQETKSRAAKLDPFDLVSQLPNLATIKQAADALGVHKNTIRGWIAHGRIKAVRASSRVVRIPRDAVAEILKSYLER